jgi:hypothetical protein
MKINTVIKHDKCTDIAFCIWNIEVISEGIKLHGTWINIVNERNHFATDSDYIFISNNDIHNWKVIDSSCSESESDTNN